MQRSIDLTLSVVASIVGFALSWPYWRSSGYFAVSSTAWWIYFAVGFVLAVYVFYVFFRTLRALFSHEGHDHGGHEHAHDHAHGHGHGAGPHEHHHPDPVPSAGVSSAHLHGAGDTAPAHDHGAL